jgi:Opacity protein and related surface antigens
MRKLLTAAAAASILALPAVADEPVRWTGFYVGAHAGYGWGDHEGTGVYTDANAGPINTLDPETGKIDLNGAIGGAQVGFNLQSGRLVYGIEGDFSWAGINGRKTFISDYDNANQTNAGGDGTADYTWDIRSNINWLSTVRGRVGALVSPNLLIYGTGGVAFAKLDSDETVVGLPPQGLNNETTVRASAHENLVGWVVGGGAEWALTPQWSVKAEYQYVRFDDVDSHFKGTAYPDRPTAFAYDQDSFPGELEIHTMRLGLNYKLN